MFTIGYTSAILLAFDGVHMTNSPKDSVGRRDFLKNAAAGLSGLTPGIGGAGQRPIEQDAGHQDVPLDVALRVKALESLLVEKGMVNPADIDATVDLYENKVGPRNGARVVARAWVDPEYKKRLLNESTATDAIAELGYRGAQGEYMIVLENTPKVHNLVVCTLCSCYPWPTLGLPPAWYKSAPYRSRAVIDPRGVLKEFGLELSDDVEVRVRDSTAEIRYLVLPERPAGTERLTEDELAALVTRDSMIGVATLKAPQGGRA
jgi:nitrile hydratase